MFAFRCTVLFALLGCGWLALTEAQIRGKDVPPFLHGEDDSALHSWYELMDTNHQETDAQIDQKVNEWVKKQSSNIQNAYKRFIAELKTQEQAMEYAHKLSVRKFTPAAKEADARLWSITHDEHLTIKQKHDQINAIIEKLPQHVKEEIESEMS